MARVKVTKALAGGDYQWVEISPPIGVDDLTVQVQKSPYVAHDRSDVCADLRVRIADEIRDPLLAAKAFPEGYDYVLRMVAPEELSIHLREPTGARLLRRPDRIEGAIQRATARLRKRIDEERASKAFALALLDRTVLHYLRCRNDDATRYAIRALRTGLSTEWMDKRGDCPEICDEIKAVDEKLAPLLAAKRAANERLGRARCAVLVDRGDALYENQDGEPVPAEVRAAVEPDLIAGTLYAVKADPLGYDD
jgi:hypothetical protein